MKFSTSLLLSALLAFAAGLFFPWWSIAITSFIVAVSVHQKPLKAFMAAFIGVFVLWLAHAAIIDFQNNHILSTKIAAILPLGGNYWALLIVTGFVGGLVAGMAALSGSYFRQSKL